MIVPATASVKGILGRLLVLLEDGSQQDDHGKYRNVDNSAQIHAIPFQDSYLMSASILVLTSFTKGLRETNILNRNNFQNVVLSQHMSDPNSHDF